jgi:hypothetical protein
MTKTFKAAGTIVALGLTLLSKAALAATAIGHVSVTILPTSAAVMETAPIELETVGHHLTSRPGVVTVTGQPDMAVSISVAVNDPVTGSGPALQLGNFTNNAGRTPVLRSDGTLAFSVATTVKEGSSRAHGVYVGNYSVIVNY